MANKYPMFFYFPSGKSTAIWRQLSKVLHLLDCEYYIYTFTFLFLLLSLMHLIDIYMLVNRLMHIKQLGATTYSVQALFKPTIG